VIDLARRALRLMIFTVGGLLGGLLLLLLAWVLSNLSDIDPVPRPAALALPAPHVPDESNAFLALVGLHAASDREPAVAGRAVWQVQRESATRPLALRSAQAAQALTRAEFEARGKPLAQPDGPPLLCDARRGMCISDWIDHAAALAAQRELLGVLGRRCEQLLDERFRFEERLPPLVSAAAAGAFAPHLSGAASCSQWLLSGAVLAWAGHRPAESMAMLVKADRLDRGLLAASQSLPAQMLALRLARNALDTMAVLAMRDPKLAPELARMLQPWPDQAAAARRWMAVEAAFGRGVLAELSDTCFSANDILEFGGGEREPWWQSIGGSLESLACRHRIGWHPQRTLAALDGQWLRRMTMLDAGLAEAIEHQAHAAKASVPPGALDILAWRNTLGNELVAIGESLFGNGLGYLTRQADVELLRETTAMALRAMTVEPAERAAWSTRQTQSTLSHGRLSWDTDGRTLTARTWRQEYAANGYETARDAISISLPQP
jgi:hypothetical protein